LEIYNEELLQSLSDKVDFLIEEYDNALEDKHKVFGIDYKLEPIAVNLIKARENLLSYLEDIMVAIEREKAIKITLGQNLRDGLVRQYEFAKETIARITKQNEILQKRLSYYYTTQTLFAKIHVYDAKVKAHNAEVLLEQEKENLSLEEIAEREKKIRNLKGLEVILAEEYCDLKVKHAEAIKAIGAEAEFNRQLDKELERK